MAGAWSQIFKFMKYLKEGISCLREEVRRLPELFAKQVAEELDKKLDEKFAEITFKVASGSPSVLRLNLSEDLTLQVIRQLDRPVTSVDVAAKTGRARAVESMYLGRLVRMGMASKAKDGRKTIFTLKEEYRAER